MENIEKANEPKKKKMNDFVITLLGITALIVALVLLKYLMSVMHVI